MGVDTSSCTLFHYFFSQWHAFSLFGKLHIHCLCKNFTTITHTNTVMTISYEENPANPSERQIYIQGLGDWTHTLLKLLAERDTRRPVWVQGPFCSPYDTAVQSDNQILVAGGIGITPAISVMRKHAASRRTNLIWAVRDPHMLEFFVKHGEFSSRSVTDNSLFVYLRRS